MNNKYIDIKIHVKPMKKREKLYLENDIIIYETPEKPIKGRVNKALIKKISKKLGIGIDKITLIRGTKDRIKIIRIYADYDKETIIKKLISD